MTRLSASKPPARSRNPSAATRASQSDQGFGSALLMSQAQEEPHTYDRQRRHQDDAEDLPHDPWKLNLEIVQHRVGDPEYRRDDDDRDDQFAERVPRQPAQ